MTYTVTYEAQDDWTGNPSIAVDPEGVGARAYFRRGDL
jgi:hypothetical protein